MFPVVQALGLALMLAGPTDGVSTKAPVEIPVTAAENAALDVIVAAGPFGSKAETLMALSMPDKARHIQTWLVHTEKHTTADNQTSTTTWAIYAVSTPEGAAHVAEQEVQYVPSREGTPRFEARVVCPGAPDRASETLTGQTSPLIDLFADTTPQRRYSATVKGVAAGCVLETVTTTTTTKPLMPKPAVSEGWAMSDGLVDQRLTVSVAPGVPFVAEFVDQNDVSAPIALQSRANGDRIASHGWRSKTHPSSAEPKQPRLYFRIGDMTWPELGVVCGGLLKEPAKARLARDVAPWPKTKGLSRLQQVRQVFGAIHKDVRMTPFSLEDMGYELAAPEAVWKRKAGSLTDHARLLVAVLARQKIPATIGFVTGSRDAKFTGFNSPSLSRLILPVVWIPARGSDPEIWINIVAEGMPAGSTPSARFQGAPVVLCDTSAPALKQLPMVQDQVSTYHVSRTGTLRGLGQTQLDVQVRYDGPLADVVRVTTARATTPELRASFESLTSNGFEGEFETITVEDAGTGPLNVVARVIHGDAGLGLDEIAIHGVGYDPFALLPNALEPSTPRERGPFRFDAPMRGTTTTELALPPGFEPVQGLDAEDLAFGPARWTRSVKFTPATAKDPARLTIASALDFGPQAWTADEVEAFRDAMRSFGELPYPVLKLTHKAYSAMSQGDLKAGARLFRELLAAHPGDAPTMMRLAQAWANRGVTPLATPWLKRSLALKPKDPLVLLVAAGLDEAGPTGGASGETYDRDAALAAWRTLMEAAPGWDNVELFLSGMLVAAGEPWYTPTASELEEGLGRLRSLGRVHGVTEALEPYYQALWRLGDFKAIIAESRILAPPLQVEDGEVDPLTTLTGFPAAAAIGAVWIEHGDDGLKKALKALADAGRPQRELAMTAMGASMILLVTGQWRPLEKMLRAQLSKANVKDFGAFNVDAFLKNSTHKDATVFPKVDRSDPRSVAKAFMLAQIGVYSLTLRRAREVLKTLLHSDYRNPYTDLGLMEIVLSQRSKGPMAPFMQQAIMTALTPFETAPAETLPGVAMQLTLASFEGKPVTVELAMDTVDSSPGWAVVPAHPAGAYAYIEAFKHAQRAEWPAARLWFKWAERQRLGSKAVDPSPLSDDELKTSAALNAIVAPKVDDAILAYALSHLPPDDTTHAEAIVLQLATLDRCKDALGIIAKLSTRSEQTHVINAICEIKTRDAAAARVWVDAHPPLGAAASALAEALMRTRHHLGADDWLLAHLEKRVSLRDELDDNRLAWTYFVVGRSGPKALALARKAVAEARRPYTEKAAEKEPGWMKALIELAGYHPGYRLRIALHTLMCILLDLGEVDEAVALLPDMLRRDRDLSRDDLFVIARIADATGFAAEAEAIYRDIQDKSDDAEFKALVGRYRARLTPTAAPGTKTPTH